MPRVLVFNEGRTQKTESNKNRTARLTKAHTMRRSGRGIEEHMLLCLIHKTMTIKPQTNKRDNRCSLARQRREKGAGIGGDYLHNKLLFYPGFMNWRFPRVTLCSITTITRGKQKEQKTTGYENTAIKSTDNEK